MRIMIKLSSIRGQTLKVYMSTVNRGSVCLLNIRCRFFSQKQGWKVSNIFQPCNLFKLLYLFLDTGRTRLDISNKFYKPFWPNLFTKNRKIRTLFKFPLKRTLIIFCKKIILSLKIITKSKMPNTSSAILSKVLLLLGI